MSGASQVVRSLARWVLLAAGLIAVVGGLLALAIWVVPDVLVGAPRKGLSEADRLKALNDARSPLVAVVGGLLLFTGGLIGAYLTSRTIEVNRKTLQVNQESNEISRKGQEATLEITRETLEVTRQGQITDRFTKAIGQLGDDNLDIRLGGIYALERIARESAEDHGPIMEVLTAYLREHARVELSQPEEPARGTNEDEPPRPRADFQAIATVLGRRPEERRREEQGRLDLRQVDLRGANLHGAHLEASDLRGVHLERASLRDAHLENANLYSAHLAGSNLHGAHLEGANLHGAHLERANLHGAHLERANLVAAHLARTSLINAHLEGAELGGAHLEGAILTSAHLEGAYLVDAHLEGAILINAHLDGANLRNAYLERAALGAVLGLLRDQVQSATTDDATTLPWFADEAAGPAAEEPS